VKKLVFFVVGAFVLLSSQGFAQISGNFDKGRAELGADFYLSYKPGYAVFSKTATEVDKGAYMLSIDGGLNIGAFVSKGLALSVSPYVYYFKNRGLEPTLTETYYQLLDIGLSAGVSYFIVTGQRSALSLGADLGIGFLPGLPGMNSGTVSPNKSLAINYSLEPKAAFYYFTGPHLAPFVEAGYKLMYKRAVKDASGADVVYAGSYSMFDDVKARVDVTIGLKYFLPVGGRFEQVDHRSMDDNIDAGMFTLPF
jgi:hypothetical protein